MKRHGMKFLGGVSLAVGLAMGTLAPAPASAAPFGAVAQFGSQVSSPVVDVQYRTKRRVARGSRARNNAAVAGALIGAAIVGGAIIANSQRRRSYYEDDGYYAPAPVYRRPRYVAQPYYNAPQPYYANPQPYYGDPGYYPAPGPQPYYRGGRPAPYYGQPIQRPGRDPTDGNPN